MKMTFFSRRSLLTGLLAAFIACCFTALAAEEKPRIVSTTPPQDSTDVDPFLTEITVTFDRDMAEGFSWTGGGVEYPGIPEGQKPRWRSKRTCVLPVDLREGRYYRVGINSPSFRNFKSAEGVPADPSAICFTTKGASQALKLKVMKPKIVSMVPANQQKDVDPGIKELRVTFNVPMGAGCSWTGGGPEFPTVPDGKRAAWSTDRKTCTLPVELKPGTSYRLGLNSPSFKNFRSAAGQPLEPVSYEFKTRD
jgi:hypothetical protein